MFLERKIYNPGKDLVARRSNQLKNCPIGTLPSPAAAIPSLRDWISEWGCIGDITVSRISSSQVLISFEVVEEASRLLKELSSLQAVPFSNLTFWASNFD